MKRFWLFQTGAEGLSGGKKAAFWLWNVLVMVMAGICLGLLSIFFAYGDYPDVLNIDQMCEILSVSTKTGYALLKKGSIQHLKVGRSYRIPKAHLLTYLIGFAPGHTIRA